MHEMAITHGLLDMVLDHTTRSGADRVTGVHVAIGELSNVVSGPMRLYWEILSASTAAEGSRLHFRRVPAQFECRDCAARFKPQRRGFLCAICSGTRLRIVAGDALRLEAIDVEAAPMPTRKETP
jgi:hydrogenase nickel incorporation protein HypA/HybF